MVAQYICTSCRQVLSSGLRQCRSSNAVLQDSKFTLTYTYQLRRISTSRRSQAAQVPRNGIAKAPPISSPTTEGSKTSAGNKDAQQGPRQFSPVRSIAQELRKRASVTTETYIAYGACENLVKECARQAAYKIPQAQDKNVDIPKTKDGEDLGVGDGWWYERVLFSFPIFGLISKADN